jgi:hypothetical protein
LHVKGQKRAGEKRDEMAVNIAQEMSTVVEAASRLGLTTNGLKRLMREHKTLRPSAAVDHRGSLLSTEDNIRAIENKFPQLQHGRPQSKCLNPRQLEKALQAASKGELIDGHQPWDSPDGDVVLCFLCGFQKARLASRRRSYSHLLDEHIAELGNDVYGNSKLAAKRYQDIIESRHGFRPPVTSLNEREDGLRWAQANPDKVKEQLDRSNKRCKERRHNDPVYRRELNVQFFARRQEKLLARLTEAEKAAMISCKLCEREGHPEYRFRTLRQHTSFHGWSLRMYRKEFSGASTYMPEVKRDAVARFEKAQLEGIRLALRSIKPKTRGRPKGKTGEGTGARMPMIAYCQVTGMSDYQISTYWEDVTDHAAAKTTINSFIDDHAADIALWRSIMSGLPEPERETMSGLSESQRTVVKTMAATTRHKQRAK